MRNRLAPILTAVALVMPLVSINSARAWSTAPPIGGSHGAKGTASEELRWQPGSNSLASIVATGKATGVRLLIVDSSDKLIAIWSNAVSPEYRLVVRLAHRNGPETPPTGGILAQYQALADSIDWAQRGLVYARPH